jgi:hypothetical protein|nr:MAG TPA: hypothetical protein [Caudoviricetes sp.]
MKTYRLLWDLPFAEAGEIFTRGTDLRNGIDYIEIYKKANPEDYEETCFGFKMNFFLDNFDEWFEELPDLNEYFYITDDGKVDFVVEENHNLSKRRKEIGNIFRSQEETEKHIAYLKAETILKEDTKGYKPDWGNEDEPKYSAYFNTRRGEPDFDSVYVEKQPTIYFRNIKQIEESFKKHPEEWKTYLTYGQ